MIKFILGVIVGIIIASVGINGIVKIIDNSVVEAKEKIQEIEAK